MDSQRDRQTDGQNFDGQDRASNASHGKTLSSDTYVLSIMHTALSISSSWRERDSLVVVQLVPGAPPVGPLYSSVYEACWRDMTAVQSTDLVLYDESSVDVARCMVKKRSAWSMAYVIGLCGNAVDKRTENWVDGLIEDQLFDTGLAPPCWLFYNAITH